MIATNDVEWVEGIVFGMEEKCANKVLHSLGLEPIDDEVLFPVMLEHAQKDAEMRAKAALRRKAPGLVKSSVQLPNDGCPYLYVVAGPLPSFQWTIDIDHLDPYAAFLSLEMAVEFGKGLGEYRSRTEEKVVEWKKASIVLREKIEAQPLQSRALSPNGTPIQI